MNDKNFIAHCFGKLFNDAACKKCRYKYACSAVIGLKMNMSKDSVAFKESSNSESRYIF